MAQDQLPRVQYELIRLTGGLDLVTPTLSLPPGVARDATNWECAITGGYTRIAGYERYDGRTSPSGAVFGALTVTITGSIAAGNTITGATSGASAYVIAVSGTMVVYTKLSGGFSLTETVRVGGSPQGTVTSLSPPEPFTAQQQAVYANLAADAYRADIQAVPGSGPIRGVAYYNGSVYAWRDNAGGTALALYKSSTAGWTAVSLGIQLNFTTGVSQILDGQTVIGLTSGASGVVTRVVVRSGTWTAGTAAGSLIFTSITGTFQNGEALRVTGVTRATCSGTQSAITLLPGGRVETVTANFGGSVATTRLYGCDGVNKAFEFDGTVFVPISTGMTQDSPAHIAFHKSHLFLSFGSSVQFSAIGDPYVWSPVFGAGEIALIDNVTNFLVLPGDQSTGSLAIYSDSNTFILYGTSEANFNLVSYNVGSGAKPYTGQNMSNSFVFDDRGVLSLQTTLNFGNFDSAALTLNIRPFTQQRRNIATASNVNREKGQYRIFFSDGAGLYLTFRNNEYLGAMPVQFPNAVVCICEGEKQNGPETQFFGSDNGFVYQLDVGTSFDGEQIPCNLLLTFDSIKSPRMLKRYRKASLEITGNGYAEFGFRYDLGYGSTEIPQPVDQTVITNLSGSYWDLVNWDAFYWDGRTLLPSEVEVDGTAENIAVQLSSLSDYFEPFTINSVILHYTFRRGLR